MGACASYDKVDVVWRASDATMVSCSGMESSMVFAPLNFINDRYRCDREQMRVSCESSCLHLISVEGLAIRFHLPIPVRLTIVMSHESQCFAYVQ
jgi:hypothetical protein